MYTYIETQYVYNDVHNERDQQEMGRGEKEE